jgi:spermidine synthase
VYAEVSLIVTAFMAGLALGGMAANRWLAVRKEMIENRRRIKQVLLAELAAVVVYALAFPLILRASIPAPALVFPLLALFAGFLTGMGFPLVVALQGGEVGQSAGMLYGADLLGGCLGALLGAIFLVPILGIPQTCLMVALFGVVGVLALV